MSKIKWVGIVRNVADYQSGNLPDTATKLDMPKTMGKMMFKAIPFLIPSVAIIFLSVFLKSHFADCFVMSHLYVAVGFLLGFLLIPLHEVLHGVVYPKGATVYIGFVPKQFTAVALVSYPISRRRFAIMSLLPMVLGIIPLVVFLISSPANLELNGIMFGLMTIGLISPYPDLYNVYQSLKQTEKGSMLQFEKDDLYSFVVSEI